jgi:putative transposase
MVFTREAGPSGVRIFRASCTLKEGDAMKRKRYSNEQIAFALRQNGTTVEEVCRKLGVSEATFYRWKQQFAGMGVVEIRRLKQLEEQNAKLKRLVADLSLDKTMLQDVLRRKF